MMTFLPRGPRTILIATLTLASLALAGCSDPDPYDQELEGTLEDGDSVVEEDDSRFDDYTFEAKAGWTLTAEMRSEAFQPYLWLFGPSGQSLMQQASLGNNTVTVTHTATESGTYKVRANSVDGTGRGAYTVHITAGPAAAAPTSAN